MLVPALRLHYNRGMTKRYAPTSVRPSPELREQLAEIKRKTAVLEYLAIGRKSPTAGKGIEDVLETGARVELAGIAAVWTPEHERLLETLAPPSTLRESRAKSAALVAESAARDFGPGTPEDAKAAEGVRLARLGASQGAVGKHLGVTQQRVSQWLQKAAEVPPSGGGDRLRRARSRSKTAAPVKHVTPAAVSFRAPGQAS